MKLSYMNCFRPRVPCILPTDPPCFKFHIQYLLPSFLRCARLGLIMHASMVHSASVVAAVLYWLPLASAAPRNEWTRAPACRYLPGDAGWPTDGEWSELNSTIGGRLIRGTPLAQSCYESDYDATSCASLQTNWTETAT